jgi:hypothetical protein
MSLVSRGEISARVSAATGAQRGDEQFSEEINPSLIEPPPPGVTKHELWSSCSRRGFLSALKFRSTSFHRALFAEFYHGVNEFWPPFRLLWWIFYVRTRPSPAKFCV